MIRLRNNTAGLKRLLDQEIADVPRKVKEGQIRLTLTVLMEIADQNPVLTGHSRDNWQAGPGGAPDSAGRLRDPRGRFAKNPDFTNILESTERTEKVKETGDDISVGRYPIQMRMEAEQALQSLQPFGVTYIYNSVPYITELEYGPGFSQQQPNGWVRATLLAYANWVISPNSAPFAKGSPLVTPEGAVIPRKVR